MKYKRRYLNGKVDKLPRVIKTETRITACLKGYYISVDVMFLSGRWSSSNFPCKHSPSYKALKERLKIIKDAVELFNDKRELKKIGGVYKLVQS